MAGIQKKSPRNWLWMLLKMTKKLISRLIKKSAISAKNGSVFMPVQQTCTLLTRKERRWWNLLVVWNVAPAKSPASMVPSSGNTLRVDSVFNIDLDDGKQFYERSCGCPGSLFSRITSLSVKGTAASISLKLF